MALASEGRNLEPKTVLEPQRFGHRDEVKEGAAARWGPQPAASGRGVDDGPTGGLRPETGLALRILDVDHDGGERSGSLLRRPRFEHAKLVSLRIGQNDPRQAALGDRRGPVRGQAGDGVVLTGV